MRTRLTVAAIAIPSLAGACMACLVAAAVLVTPASPLALGRADAMLGRGMPEAAVANYEAIGAASPFASMRGTAFKRAARVYELELGRPADARLAVKRALALGVSAVEEGQLREQLAELYLSEDNDSAAGKQFKLAYEADPTVPARLVRAAEVQATAGQHQAAQALWKQVKADAPDLSGRADLGIGELSLSSGRPSAALAPFQRASRSPDEGVANAARLGLATCYERLGELDGALAAIDQADLPDPVRERRKNALIERQSVAAVLDDKPRRRKKKAKK